MSDSSEQRIDLQAAADRLGIHYQTAYRWVRNGKLNAEMLDGRYQVSERNLLLVEESRRRPSAPPAPTPKRLESSGTQMLSALLAGDEAAATKIGHRLTEEGTSIQDLIENVLVPPLQQIGARWRVGKLAIWEEHRASSIVERLLGSLAPNPRGRRRGTVLVAAVAGDRHSLPTAMAALSLRGDHWWVHHLGADLPGEELIQFRDQNPIDLVVISVTNPDVLTSANATAKVLQASGTPTIVGGAGDTLSDLILKARSAIC
jgi:excisionase family DNA binding protein